MTEQQGPTLEHTIGIDAPPSIVYALWTTADGLAAWWGATAEVDARVGGTIRVAVDDRHVMRGVFTSLEPPDLVAFTFGWEGGDPPPGTTRVVVRIAADPDGGSRVTLRHDGLPPAVIESHTEGWSHFLGELVPASALRRRESGR